MNFDWNQVNHAIFVGERDPDHLKMHHEGGFVDDSVFSEFCSDTGLIRRRVNRAAIRGLLELGASLIFNRMDLYAFALGQLCGEVSRITRASTVANGYVAFRDKESFGRHWDTHDVFAVQLIGRKRWLVYTPTEELPGSGNRSKHRKHECPADPVLDIVLEAGDVLYLPRGWWHTAIPLCEETFHVAIGVHPIKVVDYLTWIVDEMEPSNVSMRRSLLDKQPSDVQSLLAEVGKTIAAAIEDPESFDRFKRERLGAERMPTLPTLPLQRQDVKPDEASWRDSLIRLSSRRAAGEIASKERINGAALELGKPAVDMLRILAESGSVRFEDLAARSGIDEERLRYMLSDLRTYDVISRETALAPAIAQP